MKHRFLISVFPVIGLTAIGWSSLKVAASPETSASSEASSGDGDVQQIREVQVEISKEVGMAAPLDEELIDGVDPVVEQWESGYIIPATLQEVKAALAAAAATPDREDDIQALILKHRGSYRFFVGANPENGQQSASGN